MDAYSEVLVKMDKEQAVAINSQKKFAEAACHIEAAMELCPSLGKFLRSAVAEAERFQEYAENDEYGAYYRAQEALDQIDEVEQLVLKQIADVNKRPTNKKEVLRTIGYGEYEFLEYRTHRRIPKPDKYKTKWHNRKAGLAAKEAMAIWNQI